MDTLLCNIPNYFVMLTLSPVLGEPKLDWRLSHEKPTDDCAEAELDPAYRESVKCKIFLGFTSNLVSSGVREIIRFIAQHGMVNPPTLLYRNLIRNMFKYRPFYESVYRVCLYSTVLRLSGQMHLCLVS